MTKYKDLFDLNSKELSKWENRQGYKWENKNFKNLIASVSAAAGDCTVIQINKQTEKEITAFAKREMAWGPLTAIFVKYAGLANKNTLNKIKKHDKFIIYRFNTDAIELYLNQSLFWWDKPNMISDLNLNTPLYDYYSFLKPNTNSLNLHLMGYKEGLGRNVLESIKSFDSKKRDLVFEERIIYYPEDCYNLLEAILNESPYESELPYAVERILLNPKFFIR